VFYFLVRVFLYFSFNLSFTKLKGNSRTKVSAPPGFSAPSRVVPPPGFSSQDRSSNHFYDTSYSGLVKDIPFLYIIYEFHYYPSGNYFLYVNIQALELIFFVKKEKFFLDYGMYY
jgi:hypothetical protein